MQTHAEIENFLAEAKWAEAAREPLRADFSTRRFTRLRRENGETAIMMMADPGQKTDIFVHLALVLRRLEIPAPQMIASDIPRALVLMEDFGPANLGAALDAGADRTPHDQTIARMLCKLHDRFDQTMVAAVRIPVFNAALFTDQATLFLEHYFKRVKKRDATAMERSGFVEAWHESLAPLDVLPRSLLLRDFMPDNAMVLDKPLFGFDLGILDFQDAGLGPIAYDLASWCEEIRRDGGHERLESLVDSYCEVRGGMDRALLIHGAEILLAQRHTRVLGVLAQLDKKEPVPRTLRTLRALLSKQKALEPVRRWFESCAPLL